MMCPFLPVMYTPAVLELISKSNAVLDVDLTPLSVLNVSCIWGCRLNRLQVFQDIVIDLSFPYPVPAMHYSAVCPQVR